MRAAVLEELGKMPRYADFPEPRPGEGEAIIDVRCASLKPVDRQMAAGTHYAAPKQLPCVCGLDGVGVLPDGQRVYFAGCPAPYGSMADRTVVRKAFTFAVPDALSDEAAAAIVNPGVSAWLTLGHRARLAPGENVLILGAAGVTGRLAIAIAKLLGAGRVVAAGRDAAALDSLQALGADATISLAQSKDELTESFAQQAGQAGFQVVVDYLWGWPAECFLGSIGRKEFAGMKTEIRFVQVGESAGPTISLPASILRSTAVTIMGTAGIPARDVLTSALQQVLDGAAAGKLRIETELIRLAEIEAAWSREVKGRRLVVIPG